MNLSYVQKGEGRELLMLHGYLASKESFYPEIEYFSRFYRVTAPDFPGMGGADALTEPYSVDDYADWTERFLDACGIREPLVIAHSFGGRITLKLLARGRVKAAVLVGCAGIVRHGLKYRIKVGTYKVMKRIAPRAVKNSGSAEYRTLSPVMRESFKKIVGEDLRGTAEQITRPVLFINGDCDAETPLKNVQLLHKAVKGSRLVVLHGAGHFAYLDDPLGFRLAAEDFLHDHD